MVKESIQEEDITLVNMYTPDIRTPKYLKQILTDLKNNSRDSNTPLTSMDRSSRQKMNKATEILNDIIDQLDLTDIYKTLNLKNNRIHILFKHTWNTL